MVVVVQRRHGHDFRVGGGPVDSARGAIAGGGQQERALARRIDHGVLERAAGAGGGQTHVDDARAAVRCIDDAGDHACDGAAAVIAQDAVGGDLDRGRYTGNAYPIIEARREDARHVGAVAVPVTHGRVARADVVVARQQPPGKVGVGGVDARVEQSHGHLGSDRKEALHKDHLPCAGGVNALHVPLIGSVERIVDDVAGAHINRVGVRCRGRVVGILRHGDIPVGLHIDDTRLAQQFVGNGVLLAGFGLEQIGHLPIRRARGVDNLGHLRA